VSIIDHTPSTKITESYSALPEAIKSKLQPVRTFSGREELEVSNLVDLQFHMDVDKPFEVLPVMNASEEDETVLELIDEHLLAVRQIAEDGEPQTVILTPAQVYHFIKTTRSYIGFPNGIPPILRDKAA
jgi:hypothetical protein